MAAPVLCAGQEARLLRAAPGGLAEMDRCERPACARRASNASPVGCLPRSWERSWRSFNSTLVRSGSVVAERCRGRTRTSVFGKTRRRIVVLTITKLPNGQYLATSVDVPGLVAQGRSESEVARIASSSSGSWAKSPIWHVCSDPSHPPLVQFPGQRGLYRQVLDKVEALTGSSAENDDVARVVFDEMIPVLRQPTDSTEEGHRVQDIRRSVAKEWGSVLCRVENSAYLTSWFMLGRIRDTDENQ